jgi:hypothetical protein
MFSITYLSLALGRIFLGRRPDTFVPLRLCGEIRKWGWLLGRGVAGISLVVIRMGRHHLAAIFFFRSPRLLLGDSQAAIVATRQ